MKDILYTLRIGKMSGKLTCDIEGPDIQYADMGIMHGLQCNYVGDTEEHKKLTEIAQQISKLTKEFYQLNNKNK